ncbi:MAG: glycosyltransferase family 4 protein [Sphingomicrobium sp.]
MRLTIVQYAGDYREAWERFEAGGKATYQAQRYSVDFVGSLAKRLDAVTVVCAVTPEPYDIVLGNGVRAIGGGFTADFKSRELVPIVADARPDRLLLTTPIMPLLRWARRNRLQVATTLADSFKKDRLRDALRSRLLAREFNRSNVEWVANHGIGACLSLVGIGVDPDKVIPWDWPPSHVPTDFSPREVRGSGELELLYVGLVVEAKGVGDLIRAVKRLQDEGRTVTLKIIGKDPDVSMRDLTTALGVHGVEFAGLVPNQDVPAAMRAADAVVIPSRHDYPEGLPLTIYEALATRTPIIASDHPMFRGALADGESALIFPAADAGALASAIRRLAADRELYATLSLNSERAWQALQLPVSWGAFIEKWLSGSRSDRDWLWDHRLASGLYGGQIAARAFA